MSGLIKTLCSAVESKGSGSKVQVRYLQKEFQYKATCRDREERSCTEASESVGFS